MGGLLVGIHDKGGCGMLFGGSAGKVLAGT